MFKKPFSKGFKINQRGQLSIFFSVTIVILITIIAFVINVGLFVKAKINLQNAVDAAAWSGASTQARQLSAIGYLNWEMRNIYKEWMFKYYILGNMSINGVKNAQDGPVDFTMEKRPRSTKSDQYNFPSVCIHFSDTVDVCRRYEIPGLPRFSNTTLPGIDQTSANFIDSIVQKKAEDCSRRTQLNFLAALSWIYGVNAGNDSITQNAPQIATDRPGAWPTAFETAIRIRNLEYMMNVVSFGGKNFNTGICTNPGNSQGIKCNLTISDIASSGLPHYERTVKAFFSAYRNLGNEEDDEMKGSFVLTEITPNAVRDPNNYSTSNLLIKNSKHQEKFYLDLKLITLNLINFYSSFVAADSTEGSTNSEAGCFVSKIGIPVPGYPFGFEKNQDVLTYYAVKGESNFIGLFNPFKSSYTKLTAYAAAKPFGGKIGPKLFDLKTNSTLVQGRTDPTKSAAYLSGINFVDNNYEPGRPIPLDNNFWINDSDQPVGGWVQAGGGEIRFGIPNLIYDLIGDMSIHLGADRIQIIEPGNAQSSTQMGLFDGQQLALFKQNFPAYSGNNTVSARDITEAIHNVRAPTRYDAQNYLIPFPNKIWPQVEVDSFGFISGEVDPTSGNYKFSIFAPLYEPSGNFLYNNDQEIRTVLEDYLFTQKASIDTYTNSLLKVADQMRFKNPSAEGLYFKAAKVINDKYYGNPLTCNSMAGTFSFFVLGENISEVTTQQNCPKPFAESLTESWATGQTTTGTNMAYIGEFRYNQMTDTAAPPLKLFSAYSPGPYNNASEQSKVQNRFLGGTETMRRNTYSTKFITLKSVSGGSGTTYNESNSFPIFSEGARNTGNSDIKQKNFKNPLNLGDVNVDVKSIRH